MEIAIVGCGLAGMAAALFLGRAGHQIHLFERFITPKPVGSGLLLQPTGLAVLERLGLDQRIVSAGARIDQLEGLSMPSGRKILDVAYAALSPDLHGVGVHRAILFNALYGALEAKSIEVVSATRMVAVEEAADRRPVLIDEAGKRHGPFDLAIDASGAQSVLRGAVSTRRPHPFAYGALWTTLPLAGHPFARNILAQRYVAARRMIGVMPLGQIPNATGPHAAFFWSIRADMIETWRRDGLAAWKQEVGTIWPDAAALIDDLDDPERLSPAFYTHYTCPRPFAARLVLIGDAAHSTSPQLGQGANMGLLDALVLTQALARHSTLDAALPAYAAMRRRHVRFYQAASWWLTPLFQSNSRAGASIRDTAFPASRAVPYVQRVTARTLSGLKTGLLTHDRPALPRIRMARLGDRKT